MVLNLVLQATTSLIKWGKSNQDAIMDGSGVLGFIVLVISPLMKALSEYARGIAAVLGIILMVLAIIHKVMEIKKTKLETDKLNKK